MSLLIQRTLSEFLDVVPQNNDYEFLSDFTFLWANFEYRFKNNFEKFIIKRFKHYMQSKPFKELSYQSSTFSSIPNVISLHVTENDIVISIPCIDYEISLLPTTRVDDLEIIKELFESEFEIIEKEDSRMLFLLCFISYRIRNNLFHGNKISEELYKQKFLFDLINNFLLEFLVKTKSFKLP